MSQRSPSVRPIAGGGDDMIRSRASGSGGRRVSLADMARKFLLGRWMQEKPGRQGSGRTLMDPNSHATRPNRARCALLVVVALGIVGCGDSLAGPDLSDPRVADFVELMNLHRIDIGCSPLEWHQPTADVARAHSADMIDRDYFAHTNPDGYSPFDRLTAAGIEFGMAAENIAYGYPDAASVLQAWLDSPGHRANIENCSLRQHGVGLVDTHWTHLFANVN